MVADTIKRLLHTTALGGWFFKEIEERENFSFKIKSWRVKEGNEPQNPES